MKDWIRKNRVSAFCVALIPIISVGSLLGIFAENNFIRPYVSAQADTVFTKKQEICERAIYKEIGCVSNEQKIDREFIIKMYYNQKATMTKAELQKAHDLMAADTAFKKLISGR